MTLSQDEALDAVESTYRKELEAFIRLYDEYQDTHQYTDGTAWFTPDDRRAEMMVGEIPYKFKSNGDLVSWPGYDKNPPGLYERIQRNYGYEYKLNKEYSNMLWMVDMAGFADPWEAAERIK